MKPLAAYLPFGHLLSIEAKRATDEDKDKEAAKPKQEDGESDEDYAKRCEEWKKDEDDKKARRAEKEDKDGDDEESEDDDKAKKAYAANTARILAAQTAGHGAALTVIMRRAGKAERARCRKIFAAPQASIIPDVARHLAFETDLSAADAVGTLSAIKVGKGGSYLRDAMAQVGTPRVGNGDPAPQPGAGDDAKALAARVLAAGRKARGIAA